MSIKEIKRTIYDEVSDSNINHETVDHRMDTNHYHLPATRMHDANLHGFGIASGLTVKKTDTSELTIYEGLAIDVNGRMIPLASIGEEAGQPGKAYIKDVTSDDNLTTVPVVFPTNDLSNGTYFLTIELATTQILGPDGWTYIPIEGRMVTENGSDRIIYTPLIKMQATPSFTNDGTSIIIATVQINGGQISNLTGDDRQLINVKTGEVVFNQGDQIGTGPEVGEKNRGTIKPISTGGLKIEVPNSNDQIIIQKDSDTNFQNFILKANNLKMLDNGGREVYQFSSSSAALFIGASGNEGDLIVKDGAGREVMHMNGSNAALYIGASGNEGDLIIKDGAGREVMHFDSNNAVLYLGANGNEGDLSIRNNSGNETARIDGQTGHFISNGNIIGGNPARYVRYVRLFAQGNGPRTVTSEIDLGSSRRFFAFAAKVGMDPLANFDKYDGQAAEVYRIDGNSTFKWIYGGRHFGSSGSDANFHSPIYKGTGRRITFRARTFDNACLMAIGVVFYE